MSLKDKTARGLLWGTLSNGAQQLLNLGFGIALGRLLTPADYGMVGQLAIFSFIASTLQESGFTAALVNRPGMAHRDYNAVFWFCLPVSLTLYLLLFLAAPWIADFYHSPQLVPLARYAFLSFVISGLGIVPAARLFRQMRVRERTLANLFALFLSGCVGVTLAWQGFAYWGIATQTLVYIAANTVLYWTLARWRPTLEWDFAPIREMWGFSSRLLLTSLLAHVNHNFFSVFLGRLYGDRAVGNFNQANKWCFMGHGLVSGVVQGVAQPLFVETKGDVERERRVFRKMLRFTAFLAFPVMFGLSFIAHDLILLAIGARWLESAAMLAELAIGGAFFPLTTLYTQYLLARGRSQAYFRGLLALVVVQLAAAFVVHPFGVMAMLRAYIALNVVWLLVWHCLVRTTLGLSLRHALADMTPFALTAAGAMAATRFLLRPQVGEWPLVLLLLSKVAVAAVLYLVVLRLAGAEILRESWSYLRRKRR